MFNLANTIDQLGTLLSMNEHLSHIHFINAFTGAPKPSPLQRATIALGVKSMEEKDVNPVYSKVDESEGEIPQLLYNHMVNLRLSMSIFVPQTGNGIDCYTIFTQMSRHLLDSGFNIHFVGAGCGPVEYNRDIGAFSLETYVDIEETYIV